MKSKTLLRTRGLVPLGAVALFIVIAWLSSSPLRSSAMSTDGRPSLNSVVTSTPPAGLQQSELDVVVIIDRTSNMIANGTMSADLPPAGPSKQPVTC
jgi:hypothetical protein